MKKFLLILMTCAMAMGLYAQSVPSGDAQSCPGTTTVTDYDGNVYNTVRIGGQCWMKQNLKTKHFADGTVITSGYRDTLPYYIPSGNTEILYNWKAAMHEAAPSSTNPSGVQGVCPNGWHLPSWPEWEQLRNYLRTQGAYSCDGYTYKFTKALASTSGWDTISYACAIGNNQAANNASGFNAMPVGFYSHNYYLEGHYYSGVIHQGEQTAFWSSSEYDGMQPVNKAKAANLLYSDYGSTYSQGPLRRDAYSVRCLRNNPIFSVTTSSIPSNNIHPTWAACSYTITCPYNSISIIARGVCWSTSQNPTIDSSHTSNGTGAGTFSCSITGLTPNTTYYVRAYATPSQGATLYGEEISFTTTCATVNISFSGNTAIYEGQSTTLTSSGADFYEWNNGSTGSSITVSPTSTTTYRVTGTNSCGNTSVASVTVTVMPACLSCPEYDDSLYVYGSGWSYISGSTEVSEGCRTYRIENLSNQYKYTFETGGAGSASFDTRLYLYDASCNQVAYNDDYSGYNRKSRIVVTPTEDGTYYLKVNGYSGAYGNFTLATKRECATPLTITGDTVIRAGKSTTLTVSGTGPYMWSDTSAGNSITVSPTTTTTYWVWGVNGCGEYSEASVTVTVLPACQSCPEYDATMNISTSGIWYYKSDSTEVAYGCRIYKIGNVSNQYKYTFETGGAGSADFDTKLYLYNDSCTQVASNDDYYGTQSRLVFTPTESGTYYLKVGGYNNRYGSFTLAARKVGVPVVTTNSVTNIGTTTATCGGNVTEEGYSAVTARGLCWSTSPNPTISDAHTSDGAGTGAFISSIAGLTSGATYYVRAYATNSKGTAYGEEVSFSTSCPGDQCEFSYSFTDEYSDGWNGNAILVKDVETDVVLATLTMLDGYSESGTFAVCDGKTLKFEWLAGNYPEETSYTVYDGNGEVIFSGDSGLTEPVNYTVNCASPCSAISLPYTENFDNYTTSTTAATGEEPTCWNLVQSDVQTMTDANRPQLYYKSSYAHSGSYSLLLNYRGVYAMPELSEEIPLNQVKLEMYLRQPKEYYQLQVGVWEDNGTFVPVATFNNSGTGVEFVECDFSSYRGSSRHIAFRNVLADGYSYNYSYNYIDDITLTNNCEPVTLPYEENFDNYTTSTTAATGEEPTCWNLVQMDVQTMTDANRPQLYYKSSYAHSGSYSLLLNYRGVYAMPELSEEISLNQLKLEMYLRQPKAYYQLQVGVWEDNGIFVPVATFNNSGTGIEFVECDFSSYTGNGNRIAFRNVLASGYNYNYSYNYIDDITLTNTCNPITLPYAENFDSYTTSTSAETGVQPDCWNVTQEDVALTASTKPQLYHSTTYATSGSYTLRMKNRCVYAMPELDENVDVSGLTMTFKLRQPKAVYRLQVGVVDGQGTFKLVKTVNNASTGTEDITVDFANYTGSGHRIAFRNTLVSGSTLDYSINYIDDITLDYTPAPCGISELPYTENFDNYTTVTTAETGVQPRCWEVVSEDVALTASTKPQLYHSSTYATSGSYTLRMKNRCVYAMPELDENVDISGLTMTFKLRQPKAVYRLQVGVVDGQGTFKLVKTLNNASTGTEDVTVSFANYTGHGHRIAFRNTLLSGSTLDYSINYIDDITLDYTPAPCGISELPYAENFDSYTTVTTAETGVQPRCWEVVSEDVALTASTKPQLYHSSTYATSGSYTLRMKNRCVYAMPELDENVDISGLTMTFKLRQPKAVYRLQVGVVDGQGTFKLVKTLNNASTSMEDVTVDFANYTGNGHRIAFRNTLLSGSTLDYSINYIDDINLFINNSANSRDFIFTTMDGEVTNEFSSSTGEGLQYIWKVNDEYLKKDTLVWVEYEFYRNGVALTNRSPYDNNTPLTESYIENYISNQTAVTLNSSVVWNTKNEMDFQVQNIDGSTSNVHNVSYYFGARGYSDNDFLGVYNYYGNHFPYSVLGSLTATTNYYDDLWMHFLAQRPITQTIAPFLLGGEYTVIFKLYATSYIENWMYTHADQAEGWSIAENTISPRAIDSNGGILIGGHRYARGVPTLLADGAIHIHVDGPDYEPETLPRASELAPALTVDAPDMEVYPNPTKEFVNVQCTMNNVQGSMFNDQGSNVQCLGIEVIDVYGKVVNTLNVTDNQTQINVSGLAAGMYFVRVTTDKGVVTKPFVKR